MRYFLLLFVVSLLLLPASSDACDPVNASIDGNVTADTYIIIVDEDDQQDPKQCYGETLHQAYTYEISATCSTSGFGPGFGFVWGNNLSGTYKVSSSGSGCNTLCACTP